MPSPPNRALPLEPGRDLANIVKRRENDSSSDIKDATQEFGALSREQPSHNPGCPAMLFYRNAGLSIWRGLCPTVFVPRIHVSAKCEPIQTQFMSPTDINSHAEQISSSSGIELRKRNQHPPRMHILFACSV
jgi:hypothetical protein